MFYGKLIGTGMNEQILNGTSAQIGYTSESVKSAIYTQVCKIVVSF